LGFRCHKRSWH